MKVILESVPRERKIHAIKIVRLVKGCSLKKAKDTVENLPSIIMKGVGLKQALEIEAEFKGTGAIISLE